MSVPAGTGVMVSKTTIWWMLAFLGASAMLARAQDSHRHCTFTIHNGVVDACDIIKEVPGFESKPWRVGDSHDAYYLGGPTSDIHGDQRGGYMFSTTEDMLASDDAATYLITVDYNATGPAGQCLSFSYAMDGLSMGSLEIFLMSYKEEVLDSSDANDTTTQGPEEFELRSLWKVSDSQDWTEAKVTFTAEGRHSLAFVASASQHFTRYIGYAAIDSILFTDGPCENECMFNFDMCSWTNDNSKYGEWKMARSSHTRATGPPRDQASAANKNLNTGGYLYLDSSYPHRSGDAARLVSSLIPATDDVPLCLKFWVNMHGGGIGILRVLYTAESDNNTEHELWRQGGQRLNSDAWFIGQQTLSSEEAFQVIFEATVGERGAGDIGLDTITVDKGACPSFPAGSNQGWGDCTFLDNTCDWVVPPADYISCSMLERVPENDYNPPGHTPSVYHITDMYMKFDLGCYIDKPRDSAAMMTEPLTLDTTMCLSFWVYMYTTVPTQTKTGALSVVLMTPNGNTTIWRKQNQQDSGWTYAQVSVPASPSVTSSVRVAFEAIKGPNVIGFIGLDDIAVFTADCEVKPSMALVEPGDCTFDKDLCQWQTSNPDPNLLAPSANWRFAYVNQLNVVRDHTFDADLGGYAYIDAFNTHLESRLISPFLEKNVTYCFTFWYTSFYRDEIARLSVFRLIGDTEEELWNLKQSDLPEKRPLGSEIVKWYFGQVELPIGDQAENAQISFFSAVNYGGWAVDDVSFIKNPSHCEIRPPNAAPA